MKEIIPVPKSISYLMIIVFATIFLLFIVNIIYSNKKWKKELDVFRSLNINSKLYELKNLKRGNYLIQVRHKDTLLSFDLPIAYDVETQKIKKNDSLSKISNTGEFNIYRKEDSVTRYICTINIY